MKLGCDFHLEQKQSPFLDLWPYGPSNNVMDTNRTIKTKGEACKLFNKGIHSEDKYPNNRDKTRKSREQLGNDTFTLYITDAI